MGKLRKLINYKLNIKYIPFGIPYIFILLLFILLIFGVSGYFYYQKITHPKNYTLEIVEKVGKLIDLPDETPSVATIEDPAKLKSGESKAFFKNAQKGDLLLVFSNAKKLIIYRPSINKIIEIANAKLAQTQPTVAPVSTTYTFTILNGTSVAGLAAKMEKEILQKIPKAQVASKENAISSNYADTIIVDIFGQRAKDAQQIASQLGIKLGSFPQLEVKPNTDFLIIVGSDRAK